MNKMDGMWRRESPRRLDTTEIITRTTGIFTNDEGD